MLWAAATTAVAAGAVLAFVVSSLLHGREVLRQRDATEQALAEAEQVARLLAVTFGQASPYRSSATAPAAQLSLMEALDAAAERTRRESLATPGLKARLLSVFGAIYADLGADDQALSLLETALALRRQEHGEKHPQVVAALNELGRAHLLSHRFRQAEEVFEEALALAEGLGMADDPRVAQALSGLGNSLNERGDYVKAEAILIRALSMLERLGEDASLATSRLLTPLARIAVDQHDYDLAEERIDRALEIQVSELGENNPEAAKTLAVRAHLLFLQDDFAGSVALLRDTERALRERLGPEHPAAIDALENWPPVCIACGSSKRRSATIARCWNAGGRSLARARARWELLSPTWEALSIGRAVSTKPRRSVARRFTSWSRMPRPPSIRAHSLR